MIHIVLDLKLSKVNKAIFLLNQNFMVIRSSHKDFNFFLINFKQQIWIIIRLILLIKLSIL